MLLLKDLEKLLDYGFKIIPLRPSSKAPLCRNWNKNWNKSKVLNTFKSFQDLNVGILLGEIIDVEGDSQDANEIILDLIGSYPHPTYSSSKSIHHLFLNPNKIRHFQWKEIEFRGHGHQSVLPPSVVKDAVYRWLDSSTFPVPPLPERLLKFLYKKQNSKRDFGFMKPGHIKARCAACGKEKFLHKKRHNIELKVFKILDRKWTCQGCRSINIQAACRYVRSKDFDKNILMEMIK